MRDLVAWRWRFVAVAFGLSASSCAGFVLRQDVESARTAWRINASGGRAVSYTKALPRHSSGRPTSIRRWTSRPGGRSAVGPRHLREAAVDLSFQTLIADRGLLLLDLRHNREDERLRRSMRITPTLAAARGIVSVWGRGRRRRGARRVCRTLPALHEAAQPFQLLDLCVNMHAHDRGGGAGLGAAGGGHVLSRQHARREEAAAWLASQQARMAGDQSRAGGADGRRASPTGSSSLASQAAAAAAQQAIQSATSPP